MKKHRFTSRRNFLKTGAAGIAGSAFLSACSRPAPQKQSKDRKLVYRTLGRTGLRLPVVSMGSIYAIELVRAAHDEGIVYFHTSSSYSERNHERLLGAALRDLPRDSYVIASSPDLPYRFDRGDGLSLDLGTGADPGLIPESLEGSLQRLGLEYVDIFYLCSISRRETALHGPYMRAFEKLKTSGKARFVGLGTHSNEPEVIRAAAESGFWDVILTAYNFRQSHREDVRAAIGQAAKAGLGVVAMKTQAGVYWDGTRKRINMKAALKWVLQDENVHTTIPAFSNYDELQEDLSIMDNLALTPEERQDLRLGETLGLSGMYCQQCSRCRTLCPAGMDIPTLMRASMYAFGHERPERARDTLRAWTSEDISCRRCDRCDVQCSLGLNVRSSALAMARLLDSPREFVALS
jgi:aryl-alcohol dehydrogenase-like predicted oxidoreductase